jgi:hypothetical protein
MNAAIALARDSSRTSASRTAQALARFAKPHRSAISRLAARHPRLADLAISFPALLFALAVPRRRFDPESAIDHVIAGATLAELASMTGVPIWARKLNPRGLNNPIPVLPDGFNIRRQIANHLPRQPKLTDPWLHAVAFAARWCHEDLAIWYARHCGKRYWMDAVIGIWLIAAWAWHCANPDAPASAVLHRKWFPEMSLVPATEAAIRWKSGVVSLLHLSAAGPLEPWGTPAFVDGFAFEPALSPEELTAAADELWNCARDRGSGMSRGWSQTWLMKKDGKLVAMFELANNSVVHISQIAGPNNKPAAPETALAAHRWFVAHCEPRIIATREIDSIRREWIRMWKPYWLAMRSLPAWLPLYPIRNRSRWLPGPLDFSRYSRPPRRRVA